MRPVVLAALLAFVAAAPRPASAHVAEGVHWSARYGDLERMFPGADPERWRTMEYRVSLEEARGLERRLGFALEPEDLTPMFFIAHDADGGLLGVAMFIEPHGGGYAHAGFEVAVGVDPHGRVATLSVSGAPTRELAADAFLDQLRGRSLASSFQVDGEELRPVAGFARDSQLVASAAREALLFMKLALGRQP